MSNPTREMIARLVREELFRLLEEDRRGHGGRLVANATNAKGGAPPKRDATVAMLACGRAGWADAHARAAARVARSGRCAFLSMEAPFAASECGAKVAARLSLPASDLPPRYAPAEIPWGSRSLSKVRTLLVIPVSLSALAALTQGLVADGGASVLYQAIGRGWRVLLAGVPHRSEGLPALKPGDSLAAQEREIVAAAIRLGCEQLSSQQWDDELARLETDAPSLRGELAGRGRIAFWTAADIDAAKARGESHLTIDAATRITPSAADRAAELGIRVTFVS
jgi:hypothetical protein